MLHQGGTTAHREPAAVRPLLLAGKRAEHLQLLFPHGPVETDQENVQPRESRGHQHLPGHPFLDPVRGAISVRERPRQGNPSPVPCGRAVLVVCVVHPLLRPVRAEVYGWVLVRVERRRMKRRRCSVIPQVAHARFVCIYFR